VSSAAGARSGAPPLAVVVPAYRAAATLPGLMARVRAAAPAAALIVVDDGSDDDTAAVAAAAGAAVRRHRRNEGKGRALATGLASAAAAGAEVIVTLDADGQHPPEAIPALVAPVVAGEADLVVGARARTAAMPVGRQMSNWLSSAIVSRAVGRAIPDSQSGFRAMRRDVAAAVRPRGRRYEFETEFLFLAARRGFRIAAVAVPTVYDGAPSHFRYAGDTLSLASVFLRHWRPILLGPGPR
jgi:glycosyltransferase involved in cell wall biosynthesis